ncbi:F-box/kelch-repeat protein At3g06240-like [Lotus japonicus]|uniref:F-box/kelch-repeat protein At3g06240-like n=1 Tax=Lotus japonicus TaxID=34305 RepID=UPI00258812D1|nr:F-box/kelch-repeat protein At3g06240-like [Lotus japonicus]
MNEQRRSCTEENPSLSSILPDELIIQILLQLPVTSLLRFKSVSKSWFSQISNPQFAKSHFNLAASPTHYLFLKSTDEFQFQTLDIESSPPFTTAVLNYPHEQPRSGSNSIFCPSITDLEVLGSCRGFLLFLLPNFADFVVFNPSTGFQRRVQSTSFRYSASSLYGIGYDESNDDYLLVSVNSYGYAPTIEGFSLKTNVPFSLRMDDEYRHLDFDYEHDLFLNGCLHWLVKPSVKQVYVVLAFDLIRRSLSEIALSHDLALELNKKSYCLGGMRGFLGVCCIGYHGVAEIWIMKEYKVRSSWTKIVLFAHDIPRTSGFFPICFTKRGDVFGTNELGRLLRLDGKGKLLAVWPGESRYCLLHSRMYTASLLSLPG